MKLEYSDKRIEELEELVQILENERQNEKGNEITGVLSELEKVN
jgi:hypothetical protein